MYGVGALMWRIVAGGRRPWEPPNPLSVERRSHAALGGQRDPLPSARELGARRFKPSLLEVIDRCLCLPEAERVQSCGELLDVLSNGRNSDAARPVSVASATSIGTAKSTKNPRARKVALAAIVAVLGLGFLVPQWWSPATDNGPVSVNVEVTDSSRPSDRGGSTGQVASRTDQGESIQGEGTPSSTLGGQRPTDVPDAVEASGSTQPEETLSTETGKLDTGTRRQIPEDQSAGSDRADRGAETAEAATDSTLGGAQGEDRQRVEASLQAESSVPGTESRSDRPPASAEQRVESVTKTDADSQGEGTPSSSSGGQQPTDVPESVEASGRTQLEEHRRTETANLDSDTGTQSREDQPDVPDRTDRGAEAASDSTLGGAQSEESQRVESPSHAEPSVPVTESRSNRLPAPAEQRIEPVTKTDAETQGSSSSRSRNQRGLARYWTEGSHEDDVLRIQGTPKGVSKYPTPRWEGLRVKRVNGLNRHRTRNRQFQ